MLRMILIHTESQAPVHTTYHTLKTTFARSGTIDSFSQTSAVSQGKQIGCDFRARKARMKDIFAHYVDLAETQIECE